MATISPNHVKKTLLAAQVTSWEAEENPVANLSSDEKKHLLGAIPSSEVSRLWTSLKSAASMVSKPAFGPSVDWRRRNDLQIEALPDREWTESCASFAGFALRDAAGQIEASVWLDSTESDIHSRTHHKKSDSWNAALCSEHMISPSVGGLATFDQRDAAPNDTWGGAEQRPPTHFFTERVVRLTSRPLLGDPIAVKNYLTRTGPVVGCLTVYDDLFSYKSGVYHHVTGDVVGGHCVLIVGYSEAQRCWIIKNSWGVAWGNRGFAMIAYNDMLLEGHFGPMYGAAGSTSRNEGTATENQSTGDAMLRRKSEAGLRKHLS